MRNLLIGTFVVLLAIGTTWVVNEVIEEDGVSYYPYECDGVIGYCFKLSKVNENGLQTRCYYNHSSSRKYKRCDSGWTLFAGREIIGNETELETFEEKDFLNFTEYEITDLYCDNNSCDKLCFVIYNETKYCNPKKDNIIPYNEICVSEGLDEFGEEIITCNNILKNDTELEEDIQTFEDDYLARVNLRIEKNKPKLEPVKPLRITGGLKNREI